MTSRRALLRAIPGGTALLPLLGTRARRAAAGAARFPRRLVVIQWTNGVLPEYWPPAPGPDGELALTETLSPLEHHRRDIIVIGGLGMPYGPAGHFSLPCLLTGARPQKRANQAGVANGISVDQYVADAIARREPTPIRSLELGAVYLVRYDAFRAISFRGPAIDGKGQENPPEIDPYRVWRRLFGESAAGGAAAAPDFARLRAERRSVLDHLARELGGLMAELPGEDRAKLGAHLEATRRLEREIQALPGAAAAASCTPSSLRSSPEAGLNVRDNRAIDRIVPLQLDLIALALRCDLTRVVTLMLVNCANDTIGFPFLGEEFAGKPDPDSPFDHHGIAHRGGPKKAKVDRWWISQLALFLDRLKSIPEGEGTMLDNTLVLFANHMGNGAAHNVVGIPWIVAGGCQGQLRTGRYVVPAGWDPADAFKNCAPINGVLVTIANALLAGWQAPLDHFGEPDYLGELPGLRG